MIVVLMGVSGVGKTTLGQLLAARTEWKFEDADDYHSEGNRQKMAAGIPLTDADREPWLHALHERILQYHQKGENVFLACSALKRRYREELADSFVPGEIRFVYLHAPVALIQERMKARHHPYMNSDLLESQLTTLEVPLDAWSITVDGTAEETASQVLARMREAGVLNPGAQK